MAVGARVLSSWMKLRRAWDRVALYLPIMLMGIMAMSTYWLVRSAPELEEVRLEDVPRHVPDYFMREFSVRVFDAKGKLKSEIKGKEARHYPDTDTVEIDHPIIHSYSNDGRLTVANAKRALTNADGSELQLFDQAVVVRNGSDKNDVSTRTQVRSDFLHLFMETEEIRTHLPVELLRGDKDRFVGDKMHYNNLTSTIELKGRVRGVISPRQKP
jgi:lipopolysaccharide export system protein LptC